MDMYYCHKYLILLVIFRFTTRAFPWPQQPRGATLLYDAVDVVLVEATYDSHAHAKDGTGSGRYAREATGDDVMPTNLHFRVQLGSREVDLRVKRSVPVLNKDGKKDVADFPVFVIEDGLIKRKRLPRQPNIGLYANETNGSSFVVRKASSRSDFILEGIFYEGLDQLHLTRDAQGGLHRIHKQPRVMDFRDDYVNIFTNELDNGKTDVGSHNYPSPGKVHLVQRRKKRRRRRRVSSAGGGEGTEHEIQLFMVADNKDYQTWLKYYSYNSTLTEIEMNLYYSFIANSMNVRYSSVTLVDPSFHLSIIITGLLIVNSRAVSYWTEDYTLRAGSHYVDASEALESFRHWVKATRFDLPPSDHWMLFTGYDIFTDRNPNVAGLAKLGGMCSLSSVSIIEQDSTGSVGATAAHELGHSLSALHDGEEKDCFDEDNYIMSRKLKTPDDELLASRPWQFSPCSVRAFKRFTSQVKCTQKSARGLSVLSTSLSPGQVFSADLQCQLALGNGSYFGRSLQIREGYPSMCRRLFCAVPNEPGLYQAIFAMEKTSCGDGKWCQLGQCVPHASAPRLRDSCPQGDDPTAPCVREDCPYYTVRTKLVYCCKTCLNARASPPTPAPPPLPSHLLSSAPWLGLISNGISDTQIVRRKPYPLGLSLPVHPLAMLTPQQQQQLKAIQWHLQQQQPHHPQQQIYSPHQQQQQQQKLQRQKLSAPNAPLQEKQKNTQQQQQHQQQQQQKQQHQQHQQHQQQLQQMAILQKYLQIIYQKQFQQRQKILTNQLQQQSTQSQKHQQHSKLHLQSSKNRHQQQQQQQQQQHQQQQQPILQNQQQQELQELISQLTPKEQKAILLIQLHQPQYIIMHLKNQKQQQHPPPNQPQQYLTALRVPSLRLHHIPISSSHTIRLYRMPNNPEHHLLQHPQQQTPYKIKTQPNHPNFYHLLPAGTNLTYAKVQNQIHLSRKRQEDLSKQQGQLQQKEEQQQHQEQDQYELQLRPHSPIVMLETNLTLETSTAQEGVLIRT